MSKVISSFCIFGPKLLPFCTRSCMVKSYHSKICHHHVVLTQFKCNIHQIIPFRLLSSEVQTVSDASRLRNSEGICWKCRKKLEKTSLFFCGNCKSVLPLQNSIDYFALFDFNRDFKLPVSQLQNKFKSLQRELHPDKFSLKDPLEIAISETVSSQLNKAYSVLMKPLSRGLYMLELRGLTIEENASSDDPEFLMEIMELNETVAELESHAELRAIFDNLSNRIDRLTSEISDAFYHDRIDTAKAILVKFKYFDNLLQQLKERLPPQ